MQRVKSLLKLFEYQRLKLAQIANALRINEVSPISRVTFFGIIWFLFSIYNVSGFGLRDNIVPAKFTHSHSFFQRFFSL